MESAALAADSGFVVARTNKMGHAAAGAADSPRHPLSDLRYQPRPKAMRATGFPARG
jgi:hypothetical protein